MYHYKHWNNKVNWKKWQLGLEGIFTQFYLGTLNLQFQYIYNEIGGGNLNCTRDQLRNR